MMFMIRIKCLNRSLKLIKYIKQRNMEKEQQGFQQLKYLGGFGNGLESEAMEQALPKNQNSPIKLKYGLFAEQLSGTAFTMKRHENQRTWVYKLRPSAVQTQFKPSKGDYKIVSNFLSETNIEYHPNQLRWRAIPSLSGQEKKNFIEGLVTIAGAGEPSLKQGIAIHVYSANTSMKKTSFYNSDGDFLIVPQTGTLFITTEMGRMTVKPLEICIIPRGIKFSVDVHSEIKGWVAEVFGHHLSLPELGPIGANGLASPKDFLYPTAWYDQSKVKEWKIINKYIGEIYQSTQSLTPYNVMAWRGNYLPCKYDLTLYNTIGSISFDHPDPSIFTVLTCKSDKEGYKSHLFSMASLDFVIFPPRWLVAEHTFKPPYYHRNCMSEFMGNIAGEYDAKGKQGFNPGCSSLHSCMTPHGPDADSYEKFVTKQNHSGNKIEQGNMSFMFESGYLLKTTKHAFSFLSVDDQYYKCWERLSELSFEA